ncbi:uncharacterized protein AB9W97_021095 [Spinachia spinachia]
MVVEGGHYVLPLRWHGIPVSLLCHKPPASAAPTAVPEKTKPHTPWYSQSYLVPPRAVPPPQAGPPPAHVVPLPPQPHVRQPQTQMPPPNVPPPYMMYPQVPPPYMMYPQVPPPYMMYPQVPPPYVVYPQMPHVRHLQTPPPHSMHTHMLPEGIPPLTQEDVPKLALDMPLTREDVPLVMPLISRMRSDQNESPLKTPQSYYLLPYADYHSGPEPAMAPIATTAEKREMPKRPLYQPYYSHFPHPVPVTTSTPTVTAKPAATAPAVFPPPNYHHFPWSRVGSAQPTAKPTLPATRPQSKNHPFPPQNPFLHPYQYSAPKPETTTTKPHFAYMPLPYQSFPPRMVPPYPAPMTRRTNSPLQRSHPQPQYHVMPYPSS